MAMPADTPMLATVTRSVRVWRSCDITVDSDQNGMSEKA